MAERNYLVEGLSGAGKSSVYEELIRRGYRAISTDRAWKRRAGPVSVWDDEKALSELERPDPAVLFVCGSSSNRDRFLPYFATVFNLRIDDETMRRRLRVRTNNDYGKEPAELELMLTLNRRGERPAGAIDVDATQPIDRVVDALIRIAQCSAAPTRPPWSRHGSAVARSVAVTESGRLPLVEYSWSAQVLTTLLQFLTEQGIDLMDSDALTPGHRERYLARLDPSEFDGSLLRRYYETVNETTADGVEYALLDGIAFLRDTLAPLGAGTTAVIIVE